MPEITPSAVPKRPDVAALDRAIGELKPLAERRALPDCPPGDFALPAQKKRPAKRRKPARKPAKPAKPGARKKPATRKK